MQGVYTCYKMSPSGVHRPALALAFRSACRRGCAPAFPVVLCTSCTPWREQLPITFFSSDHSSVLQIRPAAIQACNVYNNGARIFMMFGSPEVLLVAQARTRGSSAVADGCVRFHFAGSNTIAPGSVSIGELSGPVSATWRGHCHRNDILLGYATEPFSARADHKTQECLLCRPHAWCWHLSGGGMERIHCHSICGVPRQCHKAGLEDGASTAPNRCFAGLWPDNLAASLVPALKIASIYWTVLSSRLGHLPCNVLPKIAGHHLCTAGLPGIPDSGKHT